MHPGKQSLRQQQKQRHGNAAPKRNRTHKCLMCLLQQPSSELLELRESCLYTPSANLGTDT